MIQRDLEDQEVLALPYLLLHLEFLVSLEFPEFLAGLVVPELLVLLEFPEFLAGRLFS